MHRQDIPPRPRWKTFSVVLETNELESREAAHAYASFGILSQTIFVIWLLRTVTGNVYMTSSLKCEDF